MTASITNNVNPPPQLLMKENAVEEWRLWKAMYADYAIITKLDKESKEFLRDCIVIGIVILRLESCY